MTRFDEIELKKDPEQPDQDDDLEVLRSAPRVRRFLASLVDISLFLALGVAMSPLLPKRASWARAFEVDLLVILSFAAFILLFSFHYFVFSWLVWGKTVGGAIFEVQVVREDGAPIDFPSATRRWLATLLTLATAGVGFVPILFPIARTLPDRLSSSVPVSVS